MPRVGDWPEPVAGPGEILVRVAAAGINRADLLQLRGLYPPPEGESLVPGLECAGTVEAMGAGAPGGWRRGDAVMALLAGGGQAELVAVPAGQLVPVPPTLAFSAAAALPEAALTAWTNLVAEAALRTGETVLVTGAASGVGTFAVQLARQLGARVLAAGRSPERLERLRDLGAEVLLPLAPDLGERLLEATAGRGVDVVLDLVGGPHLGAALPGVAAGGRWVVVGLLAGRQATVDLSLLLRRRIRLIGSVLRPRSRAEKSELVAGFARFAADRLADGRLRPVLDAILPFDSAAEAYRRLEENRAFGKVVLVTS